MNIVEIYLPMTSNDGTPFTPDLFDRIERELTEKFGGVTAHRRAPAQGRWQSARETEVDQIAIFEILVEAVDKDWWARYRRTLDDRAGITTPSGGARPAGAGRVAACVNQRESMR